MRYQDCIFDLYGTLVDIRTYEDKPELWENMAKIYASYGAEYEPKELERAYLESVKEKEQGTRVLRNDAHEAHPEIQIEDVFQDLFRNKGVSCDKKQAVRVGQQFRAASMDFMRLYPGARELLDALRKAGCRVWLLSNAQAIFTRYELETLNLTECFDAIYLSSDYQVKKPAPEFFRILLEEQHIDPERAVMIGNDGVCDIQGARNMGLHTVYVHSEISPKKPAEEADLLLMEMDLGKVLEYLLG